MQLPIIQSELLYPEAPQRNGWGAGVYAAFLLIMALVFGAAGCSSIGFASAAAPTQTRCGPVPGIAGDGVTDDSAALQSALNKAAGSTLNLGACSQMLLARPVTIPAATSLVLGTINVTIGAPTGFVLDNGARLIGAGRSLSIVTFAKHAAASGSAMITNRNGASVSISGITLDGNRAYNLSPWADGIAVSGTSGSSVSNLAIRGFTGNGIGLIDPQANNLISANSISDCGEDGVNNGHGINVMRQSSGTTDGLTIENNFIDSTSLASMGAEGIKTAVSANASNARMRNVYERGNIIVLGKSTKDTWGIENWVATTATSMDGFQISGNTISGSGGVAGAPSNRDGGISLGGQEGGGPIGSVVSNNTLSYLGFIAIEDTFAGVTVRDNRLKWTSFSDVDAQGWTTPFTRGSIWTGNHFENTLPGQNGALTVIATTAPISNVSIDHNTFTTPASSAIVVIDNSSTGQTVTLSITNNTIQMGRSVTDAVIRSGSATLTSASASFTVNDVGRWVMVRRAGASKSNLLAQISTVNSAKSVTLSVPALRSVSGASTLIAQRTKTAGILLANRGIVSVLIAGNQLFDMQGPPCDFWGIQIVNGAQGRLSGNKFNGFSGCQTQIQ